MTNNSQADSEVQDFDIKYWLFKVLGYWYYFVIVGVLFLTAARVYLRYTENTYRVQVSILINDDSGSNDLSASLFTGIGGGRAGSNENIVTEIAVIKSFDIVRETLDSLNFEVSFFKEGQVKAREIYNDAPIEIKAKPEHIQTGERLYFDFEGFKQFKVIVGDLENNEQNTYECRFGEPCESEKFSFVTYIKDSSKITKYEEPLYIRLNNLDRLTVRYIGRVQAEAREQTNRFFPTQIIDLSIGGSLTEKNTAFLNALSQVFINYKLEEKNIKANNTIKFIDNQLNSIVDSLTWVELALENYRASRGIIDISSKGELVLTKLTDLENQKSLIELNRKYYRYLADYLDQISGSQEQIIAPTSVGIADPSLGALILELNQLISKRALSEVTLGKNSLILQGIDDQIRSVKGRLVENVKNIIASSQLSLDQIEERLAELRLEINELPRNERELLTIQRKFNVNNELYTFLLKQKAESEITRAATTPNIKILDKARGFQATLIGPKSKRIYLVAILSTVFFVLGVILMKFFLNDRISDLGQISKNDKVSILTEVPHIKNSKKGGMLVQNSPRGRLAEAFRSLRINLDFVAIKEDGVAKVIGITSAASGEGKTFCSINLAHILALAGKKTLLIGLDLRKPRIQEELNLNNEKGLSSYLIAAANFDEIIQRSETENLDLITSGPIPPNPTELIENGRLEVLLNKAKKDYDYIIIDGPPIGLVTDYIAAASLIQTTLFVIRMNYSKLQSYKVLLDYVERGILKRSHLIVNDEVSTGRGKYGYGYGYYTEEAENNRSLWRRIFSGKRA